MQELTFETQYLAAISFLTAVLFGNTFGFCFGGQREIVSAMSEEVFALELLLQELFIQIPEPNLRWRVIKHIKCAAFTCFPCAGVSAFAIMCRPLHTRCGCCSIALYHLPLACLNISSSARQAGSFEASIRHKCVRQTV